MLSCSAFIILVKRCMKISLMCFKSVETVVNIVKRGPTSISYASQSYSYCNMTIYIYLTFYQNILNGDKVKKRKLNTQNMPKSILV